MVRSHRTDFIHKISAHYKRWASPLYLPFMNLANGIQRGVPASISHLGHRYFIFCIFNAVISDEKMHPDSSTEFDSSSSCSTASPGGDTPGCSQQHPPDSLSSSVDGSKVEDHPGIMRIDRDLAG